MYVGVYFFNCMISVPPRHSMPPAISRCRSHNSAPQHTTRRWENSPTRTTAENQNPEQHRSKGLQWERPPRMHDENAQDLKQTHDKPRPRCRLFLYSLLSLSVVS